MPTASVSTMRSIKLLICCADKMDTDQRQRFLNNMKVFIQGSRVEQELRISGRVPTMEEYWGYRMSSSAVDVTSSMTE